MDRCPSVPTALPGLDCCPGLRMPHCQGCMINCVAVLLSAPSWEAEQPLQLQGEGRPAPGAVQSAGWQAVVLALPAPGPTNNREAPGLALPSARQVGGILQALPTWLTSSVSQNLPRALASTAPTCCSVHLGNRLSYPSLAGEEMREGLGPGDLEEWLLRVKSQGSVWLCQRELFMG